MPDTTIDDLLARIKHLEGWRDEFKPYARSPLEQVETDDCVVLEPPIFHSKPDPNRQPKTIRVEHPCL